MAKHRPYTRLRKDSMKEAWWKKMEEGYKGDMTNLAKDFPFVMNLFSNPLPPIKDFKKIEIVDEESGKKKVVTVDEQVSIFEKWLDRLYAEGTPENLNRLQDYIIKTDPDRQAQVRGTISWIMKEYDTFNPSTIISIYNQIASSHESGEDFYESFISKLSEAAVQGKSVARVGGSYLRDHARVTVI